jgi:hypothetical protein
MFWLEAASMHCSLSLPSYLPTTKFCRCNRSVRVRKAVKTSNFTSRESCLHLEKNTGKTHAQWLKKTVISVKNKQEKRKLK